MLFPGPVTVIIPASLKGTMLLDYTYNVVYIRVHSIHLESRTAFVLYYQYDLGPDTLSEPQFPHL